MTELCMQRAVSTVATYHDCNYEVLLYFNTLAFPMMRVLSRWRSCPITLAHHRSLRTSKTHLATSISSNAQYWASVNCNARLSQQVRGPSSSQPSLGESAEWITASETPAESSTAEVKTLEAVRSPTESETVCSVEHPPRSRLWRLVRFPRESGSLGSGAPQIKM